MPILIEDQEFTLFADRDRTKLARLSFNGRIEWFDHRLRKMLVEPLERLRPTNRGASWDDLWSVLMFGTVLFNGVETLGSFCVELKSGNRKRFDAFVTRFMDPVYHPHLDALWGFRNGLTHGLTVEEGHFEFFDGASLRVVSGEVEIDPDSLLRDFEHALATYLQKLLPSALTSDIRVHFEGRFEDRYKVPPCHTSAPRP